jgi:hypothetical protein
MSEDNRLDAEHYRLPRLTMRNWTLEFKESFKEYALKSKTKVSESDEYELIKNTIVDSIFESL